MIASFAEVYTHPVRQAIEHINAGASTGSYSWPRIESGDVVAHVHAALGRGIVHGIVRHFNSSPVANAPEACFGGLQLSGDVVTIRIDSDGHVWKLVYPGTSCLALTVSRDGTPLAALSPNRPLIHILQVLERVGVAVKGRLLAVGGPQPAAATPERGEVTLSARGHVVARTHTYGPGRFSLVAQPGRYTLAGSASEYRFDSRPGRCVASHPVTIKTKQPAHANVYCQRR